MKSATEVSVNFSGGVNAETKFFNSQQGGSIRSDEDSGSSPPYSTSNHDCIHDETSSVGSSLSERRDSVNGKVGAIVEDELKSPKNI